MCGRVINNSELHAGRCPASLVRPAPLGRSVGSYIFSSIHSSRSAELLGSGRASSRELGPVLGLHRRVGPHIPIRTGIQRDTCASRREKRPGGTPALRFAVVASVDRDDNDDAIPEHPIRVYRCGIMFAILVCLLYDPQLHWHSVVVRPMREKGQRQTIKQIRLSQSVVCVDFCQVVFILNLSFCSLRLVFLMDPHGLTRVFSTGMSQLLLRIPQFILLLAVVLTVLLWCVADLPVTEEPDSRHDA